MAKIINDDLASRLITGTLLLKPGISRFSEKSVHFEDGSTVDDVDEVGLIK